MDNKIDLYNVVEIFKSINGEAMRSGELALFIRFKGCNLNCSYCDTKWANESEVPCKKMSGEDILYEIQKSKVKLVTLTGGEPLYQTNIDNLIEYITDNTKVRVEIETNGSMDISKVKEIPSSRISFTLDYKLPCSGHENKMLVSNYSILDKGDCVKFVMGSKNDLIKAVEIVKEYKLLSNTNVIFSPVYGGIEPRLIVEYMIENDLNDIRLQLQLHKYIWDPNTRGV